MTMISEAKAKHSLAEVARRTGIEVPEGATEAMVHCPFPTRLSAPSGKHHRQMKLHLDGNRWFCFSCEAHGRRRTGDVVQWVMYTEQVSDDTAIRILDSGRDLTNHDGQSNPAVGKSNSRRRAVSSGTSEHPDLERTSRERVLEVLETAWGYYAGPGGHTRGVDYLTGRTIDVAVLESHTGRAEVGHTPKDADRALIHLRENGVTDDELVDAGLVYRSPNGVFPVYRTRFLVPCRDDNGNVVGFFGRDVSGRDDASKYVNLRRTVVYTKSVNLYQPLPPPTDEYGQVVIVEGSLDAMAIAIAAIEQHVPPKFCPVTQSGKTLSDAQLDKVLAMTPKAPVAAFDGDDAGRPANVTVARRITERGRECVVTDLPTTQDPAEYLAEHGPDGLAAWTRFGALKADGSSTRPVYGPAFVISQTWRAESAKALKAAEDGAVDWGKVLVTVEYEGVLMRGHLPASSRGRYDTQVAKALAPHVAFESVRFAEYQRGDERDGQVEWTEPIVAPKTRAAGVANRSRRWLSRFPKANPAQVEPVLLAELVRAAGDDPDMAALLPEAVENFGNKPRQADQMTEMGGWEPPLIEPPEAIAM
ncbi:MAG: toprim domain-containing protein [Acidimicrobiales bacterium]